MRPSTLSASRAGALRTAGYRSQQVLEAGPGDPGAFELELTADPLDGAAQPCGVERFQEVVDRVHLEGLQRVFVVRGDEHHDADGIRSDSLEHVEAGDLRHVHVQENEVGMLPADGFNGVLSAGALADDLNVRVLVEGPRQTVPGELHVVDDQGANTHAGTASRTADRYGNVMVTSAPRVWGFGPMLNAWFLA